MSAKNLTTMELNSLREIMMEANLASSKYATYAQTATDSSLKNYLNKASQDAKQTVDTLKQFLV
ncbi:MAG: hypothetical protein ACM3QZ_03525 [Solirubrobacterales bacterium]